jgi:molecular chaperone GrpE
MSREVSGPGPRVRVSDKRIRAKGVAGTSEEADAAAESRGDVASDAAPQDAAAPTRPQPDYLDDLRRLQAEFDNYRKRMMREQTHIASRASARLVERLLPVLDNFDRALEHDTGNGGLELVYKELMGVLAAEGLEAIDSLGKPFDPNLHEAVESHEEPAVSEPTCTEVYRTGYMLKGKVMRPAMVVVARPPEPTVQVEEDE